MFQLSYHPIFDELFLKGCLLKPEPHPSCPVLLLRGCLCSVSYHVLCACVPRVSSTEADCLVSFRRCGSRTGEPSGGRRSTRRRVRGGRRTTRIPWPVRASPYRKRNSGGKSARGGRRSSSRALRGSRGSSPPKGSPSTWRRSAGSGKRSRTVRPTRIDLSELSSWWVD